MSYNIKICFYVQTDYVCCFSTSHIFINMYQRQLGLMFMEISLDMYLFYEGVIMELYKKNLITIKEKDEALRILSKEDINGKLQR